jgi:hypothetical protein
MDRRAFLGTLASGLLAAPLATEAQQGPQVYRVGIASHSFASSRGLLVAPLAAEA